MVPEAAVFAPFRPPIGTTGDWRQQRVTTILQQSRSEAEAERSSSGDPASPSSTADDTDASTSRKSILLEDVVTEEEVKDVGRRDATINVIAASLLISSGVAATQLFQSEVYTPEGFRRISPIQFIAADDSPTATSGHSAKNWGLWRLDPGPRGVWLRD